MAQNRKPPAYQEYASEMLSKRAFKLASLRERGLLYTIRNECWVNDSVPADPVKLARYLGLSDDEIKNSLTDNVISFLTKAFDSFRCQDLDDYKKHLADIRAKQSEGGKKGSKIANERFVNNDIQDSANSHVTRKSTCDSLVKNNKVEHIQVQSLDKDQLIDELFVGDYNSYDETSSIPS